jgi:hypothetical protein
MKILLEIFRALLGAKFTQIVAILLAVLLIFALLISKTTSFSPTVIRDGVIEDGRY